MSDGAANAQDHGGRCGHEPEAGASPTDPARSPDHSSLACAIQSFYTGYDGDTLFAVTTSEEENPQTPTPALGVLAAELAWDAMLNRFKE